MSVGPLASAPEKERRDFVLSSCDACRASQLEPLFYTGPDRRLRFMPLSVYAEEPSVLSEIVARGDDPDLQCSSYHDAMGALTRLRLGHQNQRHPVLAREESSLGLMVSAGSARAACRRLSVKEFFSRLEEIRDLFRSRQGVPNGRRIESVRDYGR